MAVVWVITLGIGVALGYSLRGTHGVGFAERGGGEPIADHCGAHADAAFGQIPAVVQGLSLLSLQNLPAPLSQIAIFHEPVADLPSMRGWSS